jgi:hypothetical protein
MQNSVDEQTTDASNWSLLRDLAVLQIKLLVDGLRDIMLVPASIIAAVVSLIRSENGMPGPQFYKLLVVGRQSEHWINLFGALENIPEGDDDANLFGATGIDDIVARVETFVVDEYKRGGVTAQAKRRIDAALKSMRRKNQGGSEP